VSQWFAALQRALPHHGLSRLTGTLARSEHPWIRRPFIHGFARAYGVNMTEAARENLDDYQNFNDFFTRALKPGARPLDDDPRAILCPADGAISQSGPITGDRLLQAKGTHYSLRSLIGEDAPMLHGGSFATVYLAPSDYHRVHLPIAGRLVSTTAIPGELFSVNARTEAAITDLFCRNERLVCRFDTEWGAMVMVLVGAMIVASIETVWGGPASPYRQVRKDTWDLPLARGAEVGRFLLGSTVILCLEKGPLRLDGNLRAGQQVRVGQRLGGIGLERPATAP
jgi:phosphatidylserine decarboxylase